MADPNQENMQEHLERTTEALRAIAMFASKDVKEYPRLFFTTDVLGPLCTDKPELPPERYCALLEKQEALLWEQILVKGYINYLFEPNKPERLRALHSYYRMGDEASFSFDWNEYLHLKRDWMKRSVPSL
jgi:hypothetical protein